MEACSRITISKLTRVWLKARVMMSVKGMTLSVNTLFLEIVKPPFCAAQCGSG
jgi:hypothetical protein